MSLLKRISGQQNQPPPDGKPQAASTPAAAAASAPPTQGPPPETGARLRQAPAPERDPVGGLRAKILTRIIAEMDPNVDTTKQPELRANIEEMFNRFLAEETGVVLGRAERQKLFDQIMAEITGFGPIEPLLNDATIDEVMVNGPRTIF